jgi:hypothetical protein
MSLSEPSPDAETPAVLGTSSSGADAPRGRSNATGGRGAVGTSVHQAAVAHSSESFVGVWGESRGKGHPGISGRVTGPGNAVR